MKQTTRRKFLKTTAATAAVTLSTPLFSSQQSTVGEDYKALVCVVLEGGADTFSMVVPKSDTLAHEKYKEARGDIALASDSLQTLRKSNYGFHAKMPRMQRMFNQNNLAVIANVGNLNKAVSRQEVADAKKGQGIVGLPDSVFSHDIQQNNWMMLGNEEGGWAGRVAQALDTEMVNVSVAGQNLMQHHHDYKTLVVDGENEKSLEEQLALVAKLIGSRKDTDFAARQIYFVKSSGWDVQGQNMDEKIAGLDVTLGTFSKALAKMGLEKKVTTFTSSAIGRTITANSGSADAGWGGHAFVFGGAVDAGIYGDMPRLERNSPDALANNAVVPTIASQQYIATLVNWLGDGKISLDEVFPSLASFEKKTLEFMA